MSHDDENAPARPSNDILPPEGLREVSARGFDAGQLASLIDGGLTRAERATLIEHVSVSDEDLDVLADAMAALADLRDEKPTSVASGLRVYGARRLPAASGWWIAIAASIVAVAASSLVWMQLHPRLTPNPTEYAVTLAARGVRMPLAWNDTPWTATRGSSASLSADIRAVRVGARLTDLEVAVRSSDTTAMRYALSVAALLDGMPAGGPASSMYRAIAAGNGKSQSQLIVSLDGAARAIRQLPYARMMESGAWIEAARIAAASRDAEFFHMRDTRDFLKTLRSSSAVPASARANIERVITATSATAPDWPDILQRLTALLGDAASTAP